MRMPCLILVGESVSPAVVQATMDLAHVDRTLILDLEVRGQKSADESFVLKIVKDKQGY